jgi:hypothetical protein
MYICISLEIANRSVNEHMLVKNKGKGAIEKKKRTKRQEQIDARKDRKRKRES